MTNYYDRRHLYSDAFIVDCYLKYQSQIKAAEELGVSRETVARAVRRQGVQLTGRSKNGKHLSSGGSARRYQSGTKITDEDLIREASVLNGNEIARKYAMSPERVARRAKKLGIHVRFDQAGGHWYRRARHFGSTEQFDETITLKKVFDKFNGVCQICGGMCDWRSIEHGHIKRLYPTVDHIVPLSKGGLHTWSNVQLAHMGCNAGKQAKIEEVTA